MEDYEDFRASEVMVKDVMSESPISIKGHKTVETAAALMRETDTGSLVVLDDDGKLSGILTEMDIVTKLVSKSLKPDEIKIKEIMSTPVHTIDCKEPVQQAAKTMADLEVRRLPVMEEEDMVGIVTENDILEISPALIDITREYKKIRETEGGFENYTTPLRKETSGYCESCGVFSDQLSSQNGQLVCPECE